MFIPPWPDTPFYLLTVGAGIVAMCGFLLHWRIGSPWTYGGFLCVLLVVFFVTRDLVQARSDAAGYLVAIRVGASLFAVSFGLLAAGRSWILRGALGIDTKRD